MVPKKVAKKQALAKAGQLADEAVKEDVAQAPRRGSHARKATYDDEDELEDAQFRAIAAEEAAAARADRHNAAAAADDPRARGRKRAQTVAPPKRSQQPRLGPQDLLPSDPDESPRDGGLAHYGQHEQVSPRSLGNLLSYDCSNSRTCLSRPFCQRKHCEITGTTRRQSGRR